MGGDFAFLKLVELCKWISYMLWKNMNVDIHKVIYLMRQISLFFCNSLPRNVVYHKGEALFKQDINHLKV